MRDAAGAILSEDVVDTYDCCTFGMISDACTASANSGTNTPNTNQQSESQVAFVMCDSDSNG